MKINRNNYEAFLLDYLEGRLNSQEVGQLKMFCLQQGIDFDELTRDLPVLEAGDAVMDKTALFQAEIVPLGDINEDNFEEFFIAYHELLLDGLGKMRVEAFLRQNPHLSDDFRLFAACKLQADAALVYEQKAALRKSAPVIPLYAKVAAVVAVAALLFGLLMLPLGKTEVRESPVFVAELEPKPAPMLLVEEKLDVLEKREIQIIENHKDNIKNALSKTIVSELSKSEIVAENVAMSRSELTELVSALTSRPAREITMSEDFALENGLFPEMPLMLREDYYLAQWVLPKSDDFDEDYEISRSFLSRGVQYLSEGRFESLRDAMNFLFRKAKDGVAKFTEEVAMTAYKVDAQIENGKARWEEMRDHDEEK